MAIQPQATPAIQQSPGPRMGPNGYPLSTSNPKDINSIVGGMIDRTPWRWWDTFNKPLPSPNTAAPSQLSFFQVAMNQVDPITGLVKTKLDTNMTQAGQFDLVARRAQERDESLPAGPVNSAQTPRAGLSDRHHSHLATTPYGVAL